MTGPVQTAAPPRRPFAWKALAVVLPFLVLYWFDIAHHTMFFDEVNAWAISAWSPTLAKMFYFVHFEGHPWLWYFILWFPSRLTRDPVAMKWVEAALGTTSILIIGFLSPFTYKQRALILSSYFLVWEYTVMCRMYSVMLVLVLLYAVRRVRRPEGVLGSCALLGLAGNTDLTGVLLSVALLVEYAYSSYFGVAKEERRAVVRRWIPALLLYVALIGLAVGTMWPSKEISWQNTGRLGSQALDSHRIKGSFANIIGATWWPISPNFPHHFWETRVEVAHWLYWLVPVVLFVYWMSFRRDRNLLLLMALTLGLGIAFADLVYPGSVRHWGISFIAFVIGLWLQSAARTPHAKGNDRAWSPWAYGLLGMSAVAGVCAIAGSWKHPFSRAREAAMWVKDNKPNEALTGLPDVSFASLAEELQRPVYFSECNCVYPFKLFAKDREDRDESNFVAALNGATKTLDTDSLLLSAVRDLNADELETIRRAGYAIQPAAFFPNSDMPSESYFLYDVRKNDGR